MNDNVISKLLNRFKDSTGYNLSVLHDFLTTEVERDHSILRRLHKALQDAKNKNILYITYLYVAHPDQPGYICQRTKDSKYLTWTGVLESKSPGFVWRTHPEDAGLFWTATNAEDAGYTADKLHEQQKAFHATWVLCSMCGYAHARKYVSNGVCEDCAASQKQEIFSEIEIYDVL